MHTCYNALVEYIPYFCLECMVRFSLIYVKVLFFNSLFGIMYPMGNDF